MPHQAGAGVVQELVVERTIAQVHTHGPLDRNVAGSDVRATKDANSLLLTQGVVDLQLQVLDEGPGQGHTTLQQRPETRHGIDEAVGLGSGRAGSKAGGGSSGRARAHEVEGAGDDGTRGEVQGHLADDQTLVEEELAHVRQLALDGEAGLGRAVRHTGTGDHASCHGSAGTRTWQNRARVQGDDGGRGRGRAMNLHDCHVSRITRSAEHEPLTTGQGSKGIVAGGRGACRDGVGGGVQGQRDGCALAVGAVLDPGTLQGRSHQGVEFLVGKFERDGPGHGGIDRDGVHGLPVGADLLGIFVLLIEFQGFVRHTEKRGGHGRGHADGSFRRVRNLFSAVRCQAHVVLLLGAICQIIGLFKTPYKVYPMLSNQNGTTSSWLSHPCRESLFPGIGFVVTTGARVLLRNRMVRYFSRLLLESPVDP